MPLAPLPIDLVTFLERPNPAVIASIKPSGELHTAATWYEVVDDRTLLVNMDGSRARLTYLRLDPRFALTVTDSEDWYTHVSVSGVVAQIRPDHGLTDIDRLSLRYTGRPYGDRDRDSWSAILTVTRWHGWGANAAVVR